MLTGSCHCGAVHWTFAGDPQTATACNCTICRRYGTLWAYDWVDEGITTSGPTTHYIRGDREIEFHFCATCGCVTWWRGIAAQDDGRRRIAVNLRLTDDPDTIQHLPIRHFDGLTAFKDEPTDHRRIADQWY